MREADRLLQEVGETAAEEGGPEAEVALLGGRNGDGYMPESEAAGEIEEEQAGRGLSRFLLPLVFLIIIIVNIVGG